MFQNRRSGAGFVFISSFAHDMRGTYTRSSHRMVSGIFLSVEALVSDDEQSSAPEEPLDTFVRRKITSDRDFEAEARARKALVDSLVGRTPAPTGELRLGGSVVMARKKPQYRGARKGTNLTPSPSAEDLQDEEPTELETTPVEEEVVTEDTIVEVPQLPEAEAVEDTVALTEPVSGKRVFAEAKMRAFAEVATEAGDPRSLTPAGITTAVAKKLNAAVSAIKTHWNRYLSNEQRTFLLYGEKGKKKTRAEEKFAILLKLRAEMRAAGKSAPTKSEFIPLAAPLLGMTKQSTSTYIYERLTDVEKEKLDFAPAGLTFDEQVAILKLARREMKDKGLPPPRRVDLAIAAAPRLKQKRDSVRTLIGSLSNELKEELELAGTRSAKLSGLSAFHVREGFLGSISVLRLRKMKLTIRNMEKVLQMKRAVIESYLKENPDVRLQLIDEVVKKT